MSRILCILIASTLGPACRSADSSPLEAAQSAAVEAALRTLTTTIAADLRREGPNGWLPHFVDSGTFFMASDGMLVFPNLQSATERVRALDPTIARMDITWGDLRITPLSSSAGVVAASYRELLIDSAGLETRFDGFVTMVAVTTAEGWRLQHLHWSMPVTDDK